MPYSPWIDYVLPFYATEPEPQMQPAGASGVRVQFRDRETVIAFDTDMQADIVVDAASIGR